jgi:cytochrome bd-type quinol oxidase subunit 2
MMLLAGDFGELGDDFLRLFAVVAFATLLLCLAAAADAAQYGAKQGDPRTDKLLATLFGCFGGFVAAVIVGVVLLFQANSLAGLVLGPLVGGALSYCLARSWD